MLSLEKKGSERFKKRVNYKFYCLLWKFEENEYWEKVIMF